MWGNRMLENLITKNDFSKFIYIILTIFLGIYLISCSAVISSSRNAKRESIKNTLIVGSSRSDVVKLLGEPVITEDHYFDHYLLCLPEKANTKEHIVLDIATLGFWEIFATPFEASAGCEYKANIVITYDDEYKITNILKEELFNDIKIIYSKLEKQRDSFLNNYKLALLNYDDKKGWLFIDLISVNCNFQDIYIKSYIKTVPSLSKAISYRNQNNLSDIPTFINSTLLIDINKNQYRSHSHIAYDINGDSLGKEADENWLEMYPGSLAKQLGDSLNYYCLSNNVKKYKERKNPELRDYFIENKGKDMEI